MSASIVLPPPSGPIDPTPLSGRGGGPPPWRLTGPPWIAPAKIGATEPVSARDTGEAAFANDVVRVIHSWIAEVHPSTASVRLAEPDDPASPL